MDLVVERGPGKSICPSEVARRLSSNDWRALMSAVRDVATVMAKRGQIEFRQKGELVDPELAKGVIRLALPRNLTDGDGASLPRSATPA